jgi:hypothetical protein
MKIKSILYTNIIYILLFITLLLTVVFVYSDVTSAQGLTVPQSTNQPYKGDLANNPIIKWIEFFVNVLSVIIVAGSAVMIAIAGVQYTSSRDNPQAVQAAKQRIWNVAIGLISYFFLFAFMQWLIPGGIF